MKPEGNFQVRAAGGDDRDRLAAMWNCFLEEQAGLDDRFAVADDAAKRWDNDFSEWVGSNVHGLFVAESAAAGLIGFSSVHLWYPPPIYRPALEAYVDEIYVAPAWRRRGVATALLGAVREWSEARNARRIRLGVLDANRAGLDFWKKTGARAFYQTQLIDL